MVTKIVALGMALLVTVKSASVSSRNPFTVEVNFLENHGNGNYTVDVGADVVLRCKFTYTPDMHWFLDWFHDASTKQHSERNHWGEGYGDEEFVTRELTIKDIQPSDSGTYRCLRKKRGEDWDKSMQPTINISVGK